MKKINVDGIKICRFEWDYINSNMYVIQEKSSVLIIDPVETNETLNFWSKKEKNITDITIILTHEHFDHINGLNYLRNKFNCTVISSPHCSESITDSKKNVSEYSGFMKEINKNVGKRSAEVMPFTCRVADDIYEYRVARKWMGHDLDFIPTPGHTIGSICILFDNKVLFTGDSLLKKSAITKIPGGSKKDYIDITREKLFKLLEKADIVCPGHGEPDITDRFEEFI